MEQIIKSAKTKKEAIDLALGELGIKRAEARVEVLEEGSRGFLGLGGRDVKVRVSRGNGEGPLPENLDPESVARGILDPLGIDYKLDLRREEDAFYLKITSKKDEGLLIGRRGQTLDAIKHLVQRILTSQAGQSVAVNIEVGDYRERREEALREKADSIAGKVVEEAKSLSLEPMTAQDRRIVHLHLADREDIRTYTAGDGSRRRVVVTVADDTEEASDERPPRPERSERRERPNREDRGESRRGDEREPTSPYEDIPDPSFRSTSISSMAPPREGERRSRRRDESPDEDRESPRARGRDEKPEGESRGRRRDRDEDRPERGRSRRRGRRGEGSREEGGTRIRKTFKRDDEAENEREPRREPRTDSPEAASASEESRKPVPEARPASPRPAAPERVKVDGEQKPFSSDLARSVLGLDESGSPAKSSKKKRYR